MSVATQIAIEEYLRTSYRPDREYIDGEVRERNLGEQPHSLLQLRIAARFLRMDPGLRLIPYVEWRVQVSMSRFRVPDICVVRGKRPPSRILEIAPYILIEVLSPEDSWSDMAERIEDYTRFGIENIWVVDPVRRRAWRISGATREEAVDLNLTTVDCEITLPLSEVFAEIDAIE
ncbi:MAG: Uma2 family endonuclease [Acidobacteria bacterium]|nr:Uma2 family endonuclease [Acidobacteriota bacterium]